MRLEMELTQKVPIEKKPQQISKEKYDVMFKNI